MNLRETQEKTEFEILSPYATKAALSRGRLRFEEQCPGRTVFQRDCDRIIHSKAFRRLMHKTQVFLAPFDDHFRTRLTHTMEVSAIARAIARGLSLNENLEEAIALGHDLGHTPFGHAGERVLNELCSEGFSHNRQSLRVVDVLEKDMQGLNLTYEVRDGILNHSGGGIAETPEGKVVNFADRIAYINHDIEDAVRAELLSNKDLPKEYTDVLGNSRTERINNMIENIVTTSKDSPDIRMSEEFYNAMMGMRTFLFERVYTSSEIETETSKAKDLLAYLYNYFTKNIDRLPDEYKKMLNENTTERVVCDYLAGMTDRYAINTFNNIFIPKIKV